MSINERNLMTEFRNAGHAFEVDTIEWRNPFTGEPIGTHMLYRTDTKDVLRMTVSDTYEPIQNESILQVLRTISNSCHVHVLAGGTFESGKVCYMQFAIGRGANRTFNVGNDVIDKRFTLFYHHDGRAGVYVLPTPHINNRQLTLSGLIMDNTGYSPTLFNVRHSKDLEEKLNMSETSVANIIRYSDLLENQYTRMESNKVSLNYCTRVLHSEFPVDGVSPKKKTVSENALVNLVRILRGYLALEGDSNLPVTQWLLYKAIHTIHEIFPLRASASTEMHNASVLNGHARKNSQDALDHMMSIQDEYASGTTVASLIAEINEVTNA